MHRSSALVWLVAAGLVYAAACQVTCAPQVCQPGSLVASKLTGAGDTCLGSQLCSPLAPLTNRLTFGHSSSSNGIRLPGEAVPEAAALISWIEQNGGEVNVAVRSVPGAGRAVFAARDFHPGDVFARIPVELCYRVDDDGSQLPLSAVYLLADLTEPNSPWTPFFRSWPKPQELQSFPTIPRGYLPLIQDRATEAAIAGLQDALAEVWGHYETRFREAVGRHVGLSNVSYTASVLLTRLHQFSPDTGMVVPLLDMGNHHTGCGHTHVPEPCDAAEGARHYRQSNNALQLLARSAGTGIYGAEARAVAAATATAASMGIGDGGGPDARPDGMSGQCIVWRAHDAVPAGSEVCISYKTLFQDRALLQYGFLQSDSMARELSGMDRHDFDPQEPWADPPGSARKHGPRRFEGTPAQLHTEMARLSARLATLSAAAVRVAADPERDPEGQVLATLLTWRQQRQDAIAAEVARLQRQLVRLEGAAAAAAEPAAAAPRAAALTRWLEANGAEVQVELQVTAAHTSSNSNSSSSSSSSAAGRRVVTRKALSSGDVMAVIPVSLAYVIQAGVKQLESAVDLMLDLAHTAHMAEKNGATTRVPLLRDCDAGGCEQDARFYGPLLASLPPLGTVHSLYTFPREYLPLLHDRRAAAHITKLQEALSHTWEKRRGEVEATDASLAFAELQHAMSLVVSRPMLPMLDASETEQLLLMPLFTEARHVPACPHDYYIEPCDEDAAAAVPAGTPHSNWCFYWVAGADLAPGAEVCGSYGFLRPDQALIMYGQRLQNDTAAQQQGRKEAAEAAEKQEQAEEDGDDEVCDVGGPQLNGMDTPAASEEAPFGQVAMEPLVFTPPATREAALAETARLVNLYTSLPLPEGPPTGPAASAPAPAAQDAGQNAGTGTGAGAAGVAPPPPPPHHPLWDVQGALRQQLRLWHTQRMEAIEEELVRLVDAWDLTEPEVEAAADAALAADAAAAVSGAAVSGGAVGGMVSGSAGSPAAAEEEEAPSDTGPLAGRDMAPSQPWSRMVDWMRQYGAVVNVNVIDAGPASGRVVVTRQPVLPGQLLAAIPLDMCWGLEQQGGNASLELAAANLAADMAESDNVWRPYFEALPSPQELLCPLMTLPAEYLHLLQNDLVEHNVWATQQQIEAFWEAHGADLRQRVPGLDLDTFKYARGLLATRLFGLAERGTSLVPLLDMANHAPNCPNVHFEGPCPQDKERLCLLWHAGTYLAPGAEVCNSYKYMTNDRALLQYGFLQEGAIEQHLHTMDAPGFNETSLWTVHDSVMYGPELFDGTTEQLQAEVERLSGILADLTAGEAAAAVTRAAPSDVGGRLLRLLRAWRVQRVAALRGEVARLRVRLQAARAVGGPAGGSAVAGEVEATATAEARMLRWAAQNGAQVSAVHIAGSHTTQPAGRGVFAASPIPAGGLVAAVPLNLSVHVNTVLSAVPFVWADLMHPRSPRAPYYAALSAPRGSITSLLSLPLNHTHLTQHTHTTLADFVSSSREVLAAANMTLDDVTHVASLIATRAISLPQGSYLVPLLDMLTRTDSCTNTVGLADCALLLEKLPSGAAAANGTASSWPQAPPYKAAAVGSGSCVPMTLWDGSSSSSSSRSRTEAGRDVCGLVNKASYCVFVRAGADITAGQEVCVSHRHRLPGWPMLLLHGSAAANATAAAGGARPTAAAAAAAAAGASPAPQLFQFQCATAGRLL